MFRDVPACSGMFRVPGFIDAPNNAQYKNKYIDSRSAKQSWQSSLPSSKQIFITGNSLCSAMQKSKSLLSQWLPATQFLRLSNLIHIRLFKLLSILHVHSWHSDWSLRLWGSWSLNVLKISFVFLWVRWPAHYENTHCYFSVGLPRTVSAFVSLTLDNTRQQYVPRNIVAKFYPNCFLLLLWKIFGSNDIIGLLPFLKRDKFCA